MSLKFTHFGKQHGLNQSSVNYIYQDSKDFLWIANFGGINKFDGYEFTSYSNSYKDSLSIADNSVWTILEKKDKTLWFGTKTGLSKYNEETDNFSNYLIDNTNTSNTSGTLAVKALFEDSKGRFYVGSEGKGLFSFSVSSQMFCAVDLIGSNAKVTSITEDSLNNLWVATENDGLYMISSDRKQVNKFDDFEFLRGNALWSVYAHKDFVWIGTDSNGIVKYDLKDKSFVKFINDPNYKSGKKVKFITEYQGSIWFASATNGLSYYSYKENMFYKYKKNAYDLNSLFDNNVSGIFSGKNDVLYVGYYMKGFDKIISTPFHTIKNNPNKNNSLSNDNVYCIYRDNDKMLWFGTFGGGINKYNPKTEEFVQYRYNSNDVNSLSHDWIRIIYEDKNKNLWIGTWGGGLNKFNKQTGKAVRYLPDVNKKNSITHNIITAVYEDSQNQLWIGTYGGGINIYQKNTNDFRSMVHDSKNVNSISDDHITSFYEDTEGKMWICTYGGGLNSFDKETKEIKRYLPNIKNDNTLNTYKPLHIYEEHKKDYFWLTTLGGGINKFYYKEQRFLNYTEADGLNNNSTMGMLKDGKGNYWISSNNGISKFNPSNESFTNYTTRDGLGSDDYNLEAFAKTSNGVMYFGGKNGITYFNPKEINGKSPFPNIKFTKLKIDGKSFTIVPEAIDIPYKSRAIFQFAAINPDKTQSIEYSYQLKGQDDDWMSLGVNRYLEFTNLPPGNYELRIRSTNSNKVWNTNYESIQLKVLTPWYLTLYFKAFLLMTLIVSVYSYYRIKLNRVKKINSLLENKVQERTITIQEKNIDLQLEKEKTESAYKKLKKLEAFKNEFTSMLAHDLKNPLVTILGYSSENNKSTELKSINSSGKKMLHLIENMLEVQKFESTNVQLEINSYNFKSLVVNAINQVEILCLEKRIQVSNDIDSKIMVNVDKDIIERVLINLLTNAIKFSPTDSKIDISIDLKEYYIKVMIIDYGIGIPKDQLETIFSKFSQVKAKKSGMARSTGLGLTFCKMAIEAHDCKIGVTSEINKGSKFYFYLPRSQDSIVEGTNKIENKTLNPLNDLKFNSDDISFMDRFSGKINTLEIYETGEWLVVFDEIGNNCSHNINEWKRMMMEAITNFDSTAFLHLKTLVSSSYINK